MEKSFKSINFEKTHSRTIEYISNISNNKLHSIICEILAINTHKVSESTIEKILDGNHLH